MPPNVQLLFCFWNRPQHIQVCLVYRPLYEHCEEETRKSQYFLSTGGAVSPLCRIKRYTEDRKSTWQLVWRDLMTRRAPGHSETQPSSQSSKHHSQWHTRPILSYERIASGEFWGICYKYSMGLWSEETTKKGKTKEEMFFAKDTEIWKRLVLVEKVEVCYGNGVTKISP